MKIAIMQPYIFPYLGYFQLVNAVDTFVFYDDVNFIKRGYINRNSILVNGNTYRFTIPCKNVSQNKLIKDIELDFNLNDKKKFLKTLELSYKKAPYFDDVYPIIKSCILSNSKSISDLSILSVKMISDYLKLNKKWVKSSICHKKSRLLEKEARLINIVKKEKGTHYVNMESGSHLYNASNFKLSDIDFEILKPILKKYKQNKINFIPSLSIIDVLMFNSVQEIEFLLQVCILEQQKLLK